MDPNQKKHATQKSETTERKPSQSVDPNGVAITMHNWQQLWIRRPCNNRSQLHQPNRPNNQTQWIAERNRKGRKEESRKGESTEEETYTLTACWPQWGWWMRNINTNYGPVDHSGSSWSFFVSVDTYLHAWLLMCISVCKYIYTIIYIM